MKLKTKNVPPLGTALFLIKKNQAWIHIRIRVSHNT
jgi:hypothetical protein